jgi:hypothetical protein
MCETAEDIHNLEAWAEVIIYSAPTLKGAAILELALQKKRAERTKDEEEGESRSVRLDNDEWLKSPGMRHWHSSSGGRGGKTGRKRWFQTAQLAGFNSPLYRVATS